MKVNIRLATLIVFVLSVALMVGCSDSEEVSQSDDLNAEEEQDSNENNENTENSESGDRLFEEMTELSMFNRNHPSWAYDEDQYVWEWLTEKTNVELDMMAVEGSNYIEQLNLTIASGDMPDIYWALDFDVFNRFGQDGAFVDMEEYKDIMPNMFKVLEEDPTIKAPAVSADGALYVAPSFNDGDSNRRSYLYRKDIFEKHNLDQPATWGELYEVSKELQEIYPGSHPFVFRNDFGHFHMMAPQFDLPHSEFYLDPETEQWTFAPVEGEYKVMVEWLNTFYEEGIIPPTWLSDNRDDWEEYLTSDRSFISVDYLSAMDGLNSTMQKENDEFLIGFMPPPAGYDGAPQHNFEGTNVKRGMAVSTLSDNIEDALKYIDWHYTEEAIDFLTLGKEGVTHEVVDGEVEMLYDSRESFNQETGVSTNGAFISFNDFESVHAFASDELNLGFEQAGDYDAPQVLTAPTLSSSENSETSIVRESINTHFEENIGRFIIGERSLDEWDDYIEELNDIGLQELLDTYQGSYERIQ